jgi:hypothetical protein
MSVTRCDSLRIRPLRCVFHTTKSYVARRTAEGGRVHTGFGTSGNAAQVAEWAGHSIAVLLKVYAKCVHGTEDEPHARIWDATGG